MKIPAFSTFLMSVLICALVSSAPAQPFEHTQEGFRLSRILYENSLGEKATTEFYYDADGHVSSAWWELTDKSKHSTNTYQYNHRGLLVSVFREFSDNISSFEAYTYDDRGNRIAERFCRSDRVRGTAAYRYDASGRRVRATFQRHKGWLDGDVAYHYDGAGRLRSATLLNDVDSTGRITYEYDSSGNLSREIWRFTQGWTQTFVYEYVPTTCRMWSLPNPLVTNTCQYRVVREEYSYNDTLGGPTTYEYAPEGFLARKTFTRSDGVKTVTTCEYDPERRLIRSVRRGVDGAESEFLFEYDRAGRMILRTQMSGGAVVSTESYQYDGQGRVQREIMQNVDNWITGMVTFESDSRGRLKRGHFQGYGAIAADLTFAYDDEECLREVRWQFSSGLTQRYTYAYERRGAH
jgi:YD repeat-containing protein